MATGTDIDTVMQRVAAVILTQILASADSRALALCGAFERAVYAALPLA